MRPINVEITMGHNIGISASYYKPTEQEVLEDYLRAVDILTIHEIGHAIFSSANWHSIWQWWTAEGHLAWAQAHSLLLLCDGGGSNSSTQYLFKQDLQALANRLGLEIRVAHYPPYTSKYNPIEHRLFAHVTRACQGVIFQTVEQVRHYMAKAKTRTGLSVVVNILDKVYEKGRKVAEGFQKTMRIVFDNILPRFNYRALPLVQ